MFLLLNLLLLEQSDQSESIGEGVTCGDNVSITRSVVMDGADIGEGARLEECLLFPGAKVPAGRVRRRTIFTADSEIRCEPEA